MSANAVLPEKEEVLAAQSFELLCEMNNWPCTEGNSGFNALVSYPVLFFFIFSPSSKQSNVLSWNLKENREMALGIV